jgi:hypothetical protein
MFLFLFCFNFSRVLQGYFVSWSYGLVHLSYRVILYYGRMVSRICPTGLFCIMVSWSRAFVLQGYFVLWSHGLVNLSYRVILYYGVMVSRFCPTGLFV